MASCFTVDANGFLVASTTPVGECTAYVVQDAADYFTNGIFNLPAPEQLAQAWAAGFILPMSIGCIAWAAAKIADFF